MDQVPIKMLRFSTDDLQEHKRIDAYREIYSRTIVKHDIEPIAGQPFRFRANLCSLPGLGLASSLFTPCHRWHTAEHIDSDDLLFGIALSGRCVLNQRDREAVIGAGEAVLASAAHPVDVVITTTSQHFSLRLHRAILEARVADLDGLNARRLPRNAGGLSLLVGYVNALRRTELTNPAFCDLAVSHIYDIVSLLLGAKDDARHLAQQHGVRAARLTAILRMIAQQFDNPGLSAATVAAQLGVTPRYVHRLLETTGCSFAEHLLDRRLERAAALLRDPHRQGQKISDIAQETGFVDLSHFNRAFRRRFGDTPSGVRGTTFRNPPGD